MDTDKCYVNGTINWYIYVYAIINRALFVQIKKIHHENWICMNFFIQISLCHNTLKYLQLLLKQPIGILSFFFGVDKINNNHKKIAFLFGYNVPEKRLKKERIRVCFDPAQ